MLYCPTCGNMLAFDEVPFAQFTCRTCPYVQTLSTVATRDVPLTRKVVDDVFGGAEAWANVDQTEARCPHCENNSAYFKQIQVRSADEPMTTFYKCTECGGRWNE